MRRSPPLARSVVRLLVLAAVTPAAVNLAGCSRPSESTPSPQSSTSAAAAPSPAFDAGSLAVNRGSPARIVAMGDLHGDLDSAKKALRLAGAIDDKDAWIGGSLVVVQTGDEIDRGDDDRKVLDLFEKLKAEAAKAGGEVVAMIGNHEVMNASFDFRYVTPGAFSSFADVTAPPGEVSGAVSKLDHAEQGRGAAFVPGGAYAKMLSRRPAIARVGETVFVHGGVLPKHVRYGLDRINDEARVWLSGGAKDPPRLLAAEDGPLWTRMYSSAPGREECATLEETLTLLHAKRMVMGHTVQKPGISAACKEKGWRIDTGMSRAYGGPIQVLEIKGEEVRVLREGAGEGEGARGEAGR